MEMFLAGFLCEFSVHKTDLYSVSWQLCNIMNKFNVMGFYQDKISLQYQFRKA